MPSISEKLKSLGVQVGAQDIEPPPYRNTESLETVLGGRTSMTPQGETFVVEARYPQGQPHGNTPLEISAPLEALAAWARDARIAGLSASGFAFLDTETTGLSGGAGTFTFLIGAGRFENGQFNLAQFFLREPSEEPAQLLALEEFLAPCEAVVTFNGKSFDLPLLQARFTMQGWQSPFSGMAHLDLLHLARRLWRERLPSRTLANLEVQILGAVRTGEDVPGWEIPSLYHDYLRDGNIAPLKRVIYHNAMDVVSLAALMNHMAGLLSDPIGQGGEYSVDLISLGALFEDMDRMDEATRLYIHGLEHEDVESQRLPKETLLKALGRLALIYKRRQAWDDAIELWIQAAQHDHLDAYVELAKCYEHRLKDYTEAINWAQNALELISPNSSTDLMYNAFDRRNRSAELEHRLARLRRKAGLSK